MEAILRIAMENAPSLALPTGFVLIVFYFVNRTQQQDQQAFKDGMLEAQHAEREYLRLQLAQCRRDCEARDEQIAQLTVRLSRLEKDGT